ncbi:dioxygenase [Candidatus Poribacteria bacterium]|nr:dioxygenase [Candidatus Poribacteria bacterium]
MREPLELKAYDTLEGRVRAIEEDGFAYFPAALSADEVSALRDAMRRLEPIPESFDGYHTAEDRGFFQAHINNAFNRDRFFLDYLDRPGVIELAEAVHGADCHVIGMTSWLTGPGRPDQTLHADWLPVPLPEDVASDPRVKVPAFITTAHFYLDDMTEELGPTTFVPGSHRSGRSPNGDTQWLGQSEQSILCKAGDAVSFRSEVWHRGTANVSDDTRHLLQVHYAHRMITQKYPPYLNRFQFDETILAEASPRQRRLLGDHRSGAYD